MEENKDIKNVVEAILFASGEAISISVLAVSLGVSEDKVTEVIEQLQSEYKDNNRGISIVIMNKMAQMATNEDYAVIVEEILSPIRSEKLTKSAIEVLSIIAYRQPITRTEIAEIRGVRSDYLITSLQRKGLVAECGKKDTLGHPAMFATTDIFLRDFNLKDITQLPVLDFSEDGELEDILDIDIANENEQIPINF